MKKFVRPILNNILCSQTIDVNDFTFLTRTFFFFVVKPRGNRFHIAACRLVSFKLPEDNPLVGSDRDKGSSARSLHTISH